MVNKATKKLFKLVMVVCVMAAALYSMTGFVYGYDSYYYEEIPLPTQGGGFVVDNNSEEDNDGSFSATPQQGHETTNADGTWGNLNEEEILNIPSSYTTDQYNTYSDTADIIDSLHTQAFNDASYNSEIKVYVNGVKLNFDVKPEITNGRTMVPLRAIFETLGAEVNWDEETQTVYSYRDNDYVRLTINDYYMYTSSGVKTLDQPAYVTNYRTLVPVRAIAESFNCEVKWYNEKRVVSIVAKEEKYQTLVPSENKFESVNTPANNEKYGEYKGIDYTMLTSDPHRIKALNKARQMVTVQWTAPCDFVTWAASTGEYNQTISTDGTVSHVFKKGKTYTGIPYSMINNTYDDTKWLNLLDKGISTASMKGTYYNHGISGTARGIDCSYFVYTALESADTGKTISYQITSTMLSSNYYKKLNSFDEMLPGDIFLKKGHTFMYIGKTSEGKYAVFEACAEGQDGSATSKCVYKEYSYNDVCSYSPYRFYGFE